MSAGDLKKDIGTFRKKILVSNALFILGFSTIFVLLGTAAAGLGQIFRRYDLLFQRVGGLVIIIFGLEFAGYLHIPLLEKTRQFKFPSWAIKFGHAKAFLIGVIFALAWTPCIGAVLGSILALAATTQTALNGAVLLFFYSLGISVPFVVLSLSFASAPKYLKSLTNKTETISKVGGLLLVLLGILLTTNMYRYVNSWLTILFHK
jgi:cytochrome c-type biogenesis protein